MFKHIFAIMLVGVGLTACAAGTVDSQSTDAEASAAEVDAKDDVGAKEETDEASQALFADTSCTGAPQGCYCTTKDGCKKYLCISPPIVYDCPGNPWGPL